MGEIFEYPAGVLPDHEIRRLIKHGCVSSPSAPISDQAVQPASLDLHLGPVAYRLRCSFVPGDRATVEERLAEVGMGDFDLTGPGAVLETNRPYLIPLRETLSLPPNVRARANPKSSTGRVDVFARLVSNHSYRFDEIAPGYSGPLYLEVFSNTFTTRVREGLSLNQLRLMVGEPSLSDNEIRAAHRESPLLIDGGTVLDDEAFYVSGGFFVSVDFKGSAGGGPIGYRAKRNSRLLDLGSNKAHAASDYWEPLYTEAGCRIVLEPGEFYLLLSQEEVRIPPGYAAEMVAYDSTSGELRTHYAGFFDPGFGYFPGRVEGSRAALEVRVHDVPFMVEHGQRVCKFTLEHMMELPERLYGESIGSHYQGQTGTLSKHFAEPA
jgi:dCTP deaminase